MNPRIEKLKKERDRLAHRVAVSQERLKELDEQILQLENTDIVGIVRETGMTIDQLADLLEKLGRRPIARPDDPDEMEESDENL